MTARLVAAQTNWAQARKLRPFAANLAAATAPATWAPPRTLHYRIDLRTPGAIHLFAMPMADERDGRVGADAGALGCGLLVATSLESANDLVGLRPAEGGPRFREMPIVFDDEPDEDAFTSTVDDIVATSSAGVPVAITCTTAAKGSALLAVAVATMTGMPVGNAFAHVEQCRGAPLLISPAQRAWLAGWLDRQSFRRSP